MNRKVIAGVVVGVVVLSLLIGLVVSLLWYDKDKSGGEVIYRRSGGAVGVVSINGAIVCGRSMAGFGSARAGSEDVIALLHSVAKNPDIRAVVLRVNSPGGTAAGAQEIAVEVDRLRQAGKKVVASMGDVSASGAYWIACRADKIVANPGTLTGSIGVIMQIQDLRGLYGKIGIEPHTFKSGPHKDMGAPDRSITREERVIFQGMVDDIYDQFLNAVANGRKMEPEKVRELADGRVFTGRQARDAGLVDELGNYREAISIAGRLSGLGPEPRVTELGPRGLLQELFGTATGAPFWAGLIGKWATGVIEPTEVKVEENQELYPAIWLLYPAYSF